MLGILYDINCAYNSKLYTYIYTLTAFCVVCTLYTLSMLISGYHHYPSHPITRCKTSCTCITSTTRSLHVHYFNNTLTARDFSTRRSILSRRTGHTRSWSLKWRDCVLGTLLTVAIPGLSCCSCCAGSCRTLSYT